MTASGTALGELNSQIRKHVFFRRINAFALEFLIYSTIIASFAATIVAAAYPNLQILGSKITYLMILAPLSGLFTLVRSSMAFDRRAAWFSLKAMRLDTVRRRVEFSGMTEPDAVYDMNVIDVEMEETWQSILMRKIDLGDPPKDK